MAAPQQVLFSLKANTEVYNQTNFVVDVTYSTSDAQGYRFVPSVNTKVKSVVVSASVAPTRARILNSAYSTLATATFSGTTATFSPNIPVTSGQTYHIVVDKSGSSWSSAYKNTYNLPATNAELDFTGVTYFNGSWATVTSGNPVGGILGVYSEQTGSSLGYNIISYWKMENTNDELSAYNLTGTGSPGSGTGIINNGRTYVGGTSRDSFAYTSALGAGSFSFWFNYSSINASLGRLITKTQAGVTDAFLIYINSSNQLVTVIQDTTIHTSSTTLSTSTWYHVVVTWNGSTVVTYLNGSSNNSTSSTRTLQSNTRPFFIGGTDVNSQGITGTVDEIGFWSRALTSGEVSSLYNSGAPGSSQQYPFS